MSMEWLKKKWELAGLVTLVLCGVLKVFGPDRLATWSGWTAAVFAVLIVGKFLYDRSATLQAILERARRIAGVESHQTDERPLAFRGLLPFHEEDAAEFIKLGRQNDVAALLPALRDPRLRVVVLRGESGSGKTSIIRAGLLPALRAEGWQVVNVDPETQEPARVIRSGKAAMPDANLLIVADQFEERSIRGDPGATAALDDALRKTIEGNQGKWLIGVRADFKYLVDDLIERYGGDFQAEFLKPRVGYGLRLFTVVEAERVISEIGSQVFDAGVPLQLAQDLARGGRVLPADVQFVGFEMQHRGIHTLGDYRKAGGRDGIIADSIRNVIDQFSTEDRKGNARRLLNSLIDQEHGTRLPEALTAAELGARAGIVGDVDSYCKPFVEQRLLLRVSDSTATGPARYRLAHDYLVQPIYTAIGHTETNYEKVIRLLTLYAAEYSRNPQARIPSYDYRLIRRLLKKVTRDARLDEARRLAIPIIRVTSRRNRVRRGIITSVVLGLGFFLPPVRVAIESKVTRELNSRIEPSQAQHQPRVCQLAGGNLAGVRALLFQYGRLPFLRRVPIPEIVYLPQSVADASAHTTRAHRRAATFSIAVGRFEVTVAQFNAFAAASDQPQSGGESDLPVVSVSWDKANAYCTWLREITGKRFRLPTSAEWEGICQAGSNDVQDATSLARYAWCFENSNANRHPVGQKKANSLGLYDMLGNVEEWVADWNEDWNFRSTRGGNCTNKADELGCDKSVDRDPREQSEVGGFVGFRVIADIRR